jgi:hypothetical protein
MTRMRIITRTLAASALLMATTSCSSTVRTGDSPMFLVIQNIAGIRGGPTAGQSGALLISDVLTQVTTGNAGGRACTQLAPCPFVFGDSGTATLSLAKKDVSSPAAPTTNNQVTISRINVHYRLSSGTGALPADFDTFATATVTAVGSVTMGFELVRVQAKEAPPLSLLAGGGPKLAVVADLTFFGKDQVGNDISATGSIQIEFGDWAD